MHSRSWPDLITGIAMRALDRIEERGGQFRIRRQNCVAGRSGGEQPRRNALRAQCCWTCAGEVTTLSAGPSEAWASSSSSMRVNTVARTFCSGRLVMRKALR